MELTPKKIVDQIKQLLPTFAEFEDSEGNLTQGNPIEWLENKIEEYGEQQYTKGYATSFEDHIVKPKENGTNKRT